MWQIEFTDQVAWCMRKIRTRPPHTSAVRPAVSDPPRARGPPRTGSPGPSSTHHRKRRSTQRMTGSARRSGAKRRADVGRSRSNSQPVCACHQPRRTPRQPSPPSVWGLCGSPSSSANVWCLRWSATQWIGAPCTVIEPRTANAARTAGRRLERAVRQQAVVADRHAEAGQAVHHGEDREVAPGHRAAPEQDDRGEEAEEGEDDGGDGDAPFERGHGGTVRRKLSDFCPRSPRSAAELLRR